MEDYKEYELDIISISFIRKHLLSGLTLSKQVLKFLDIEKGKVFTGMPKDIALGKLSDFDHGGIIDTNFNSPIFQSFQDKDGRKIIMQRVSRAFTYVTDTTINFLQKSDNNLLIVENVKARPTDPITIDDKSVIWIFQNEIYHPIFGKTSSEEITRTLTKADSLWTMVGFLTSLPKEDNLPLKKEMSLDTIQNLAKNTQKIIVSAYDGEGFLIWQQ
jgi:hypothetical protein